MILKKNIILLLFISLLSCNKLDNKKTVKDVFYPLPAGSVKLDGFLEEYIQKSIENWNKGDLPYNEFVDFFRNGRPQFALGEMWGKAVRSGCMFYRYTKDPELKKLMDETVRDLLSTQRSNGSISCVEIDKQPEESELWERKYVMLGLQEYYEWVNPDRLVLEALIKQADNIISLVGPAPKKEIIDIGWSATNIGHEPCHIESSTLLEPFMRLYKWTGEQRYLDFASYIIESGGSKHYNLFDMALNNVEPYKMAGHYPKAYEMLSLFEGLAEYYRVTGDQRYKQILDNLYNNVREKEITIIGNGGSDQPYHPYVYGEAWGNTAIEQTNPNITRMMETCVGVTWLKFCSQMLRLTSDPSTVDEIEKYIYNGLIGAMKPTGDGFSYVNLLNGTQVSEQGWGWKFDNMDVTCCNLNGPMGMAYIPYVAVMNSDEGPVINLYESGSAIIQSPGKKPVILDIESDFPMSGSINVKVSLNKSEKFTIRLRIPSWSKSTEVKINNQLINVTPGTYLEINRKWKTGDIIGLQLDMRCKVIDSPKGTNRAGDNFQALIRGPIVLARDESIDANYNKPVSILSTDGYVEIIPEEPSLSHIKMQYKVPTKNDHVSMVDYASVDNWNNGKHVYTWIPKE